MSSNLIKVFKELDDLYSHLETNAMDYKYPSQIANLFQKLRDYKSQKRSGRDAEIAQWEVDFFSFNLVNNQITATFYGENKETGEPFEYPNLDRFNDKTYVYLVERQDKSNHPLLKVRYSHILWCSPKKHNKYAEQAIDEYLKLIDLYKASPDGKSTFDIDIVRSITNAFYISKAIKGYRFDELKEKIKSLALNVDPSSESAFYLFHSLTKLMMDSKKNKDFTVDDFNGFQIKCDEIKNVLKSGPNKHGAITLMSLGEKLDKLLNKDTTDWSKETALMYEELIKRDENNNNLAVLEFADKAIEIYRELEDNQKVKELETKKDKLMKSMRLLRTEQEIDLTDYTNYCKDIAKKIASESPEAVMKFLSAHEKLLPDYKNISLLAEESSKSSPLLDMFATKIIDNKGRYVHDFTESAESFSFVSRYKLELQIEKQMLLNEVINYSIQNNVLNAELILKYLKENTWIGNNIEKEIINEQKLKYNFIEFISPSICEYCEQLHKYLGNKTKYPNLIMCTDSLALKIEGLIREICSRLEINTVYTDKNNNTMEKNINQFLRDEKLIDYVGINLAYFLKFILIEQPGYNLRNDIAHSLMLPNEYSINYMNLLLLSVFRLGNLKSKSNL